MEFGVDEGGGMDRTSSSSRKDSSSSAKTRGLFAVILCGFGVSCRDYFHYLSGLHDWGGLHNGTAELRAELLQHAQEVFHSYLPEECVVCSGC